MEFCPSCGMLLHLEAANSGHKARFCCPTCPYVCTIETEITRKHVLKKKEADRVLTWEEEMKGATKGQATCPQCGHKEAFFYQLQIRSADEPPTSFYTCCDERCRYNWRED
ncbi:DNA-directed RNA polymerase III subunit RPC10-like isoform X3 [Iris pallida]|uniref:DNA-directed RNA polymerase subunit n=1 Tax=Iris pallida TaxID=29817 RepID=A0AAX6DRI6_IRIPA|nr:DNA-directed RNA polymerase III subunit RPC10-like isoform X3 [Iris pallida]KAJ6808874.1 DNA-directed RNA polymerase III subunit RPC10-like isoform X3 [Iris pallida]